MATATKKKKQTAKAPQTKFDEAAAELRRIYVANKRRLHPPDVIEEASDPDSPLHKYFTWDDSKAAQEYRLIQARKLIARVIVTMPATSGTGTQEVRAYHAIRSEHDGYRHTTDIMSSAELRESLLAQLTSDLERIREQYRMLQKVAATRGLFEVIEEFVSKQREADGSAD